MKPKIPGKNIPTAKIPPQLQRFNFHLNFLATQSHPCERIQEAVCCRNETAKRWKRALYESTTTIEIDLVTLSWLIRPEGTQDAKKILLDKLCLCTRESSFGNVKRLPSQFQLSLCHSGFVQGSLPTFCAFIMETNCCLASSQEWDYLARKLPVIEAVSNQATQDLLIDHLSCRLVKNSFVDLF